MVYFKRNFLKALMIYICCVKFTRGPDPTPMSDLQLCIEKMPEYFIGLFNKPTNCFQHAIKHLKLLGELNDNVHYTVSGYYKTFHRAACVDTIPVPEEFCYGKPPDCAEALNIFKDEFVEQDEAFAFHVNLIGNIPETDQYLQTIILKNVLYKHRFLAQNDPVIELLTEESRKYFHTVGTYGHQYMSEIADGIILPHPVQLDPPIFYCFKTYAPKNNGDNGDGAHNTDFVDYAAYFVNNR